MPYIKCISIKGSVAGCLRYIANPDKTCDMVYVSGLNCSENIGIAEKEFCMTYQHYSHKDFYEKASESKSSVKAFHIIQSFKSDECDAELAHKIGIEWVQKAFGEDYQAVVCTHVDKDNIHNHVCLCPYDLNGKKFNSNKTRLKYIRNISDLLCRSYGIGEIERIMSDKNHTRSGVSYGEWKHKKQGTSWKEIIRNSIDMLVNSVQSLDELLEKLEEQGFTIKRGKYISVKAPDQQRAVRLKTLGADYSEESLSRRIYEYLDALPKMKTVSEIISDVIKEFEYQTHKYSYAKSVQNQISVLSSQLTIINTEHISSIGEVESKLAEVEQLIADTQKQLDDLTEQKNSADDIISAAERYFKKYGLFEKSKQYSKTQQKSDKELLAKYSIKSLGDISSYKDNIEKYTDEITLLKSTLADIKTKAKNYQNIIDTYKYSKDGDYISRLVKAARDKMDQQEQAKLKALQSQTFEIYRSKTDDDSFNNANVDNYSKIHSASLFDIEGDTISEKLKNIAQGQPDVYIGDVIVINNKDTHYVQEYDFKTIDGFMKSHSEQLLREQQLKKQQKEKQNKPAVKKKSRSR